MRAVLQAHRVQDRGTVPIVRTIRLNCYTIRFYCYAIGASAPQGSCEPVRSDSCLESGRAKVTCAGAGSDLWKATRERPDSPDLILHIELGAPLGEGGGWVDL